MNIILNKKLCLDLTKEKIPTRNGYGNALVELGKKNRQIMVLCADLKESTRVQKFSDLIPGQGVEVGVAEHNLVTVASGLAAPISTYCLGKGSENFWSRVDSFRW